MGFGLKWLKRVNYMNKEWCQILQTFKLKIENFNIYLKIILQKQFNQEN